MKKFDYTVKDTLGIHARPAGILVKEAKKYNSRIMLTRGEKSADASKLLAVMGMAVKCGQTVEVTVDGPDEAAAYEEIKTFFEANL